MKPKKLTSLMVMLLLALNATGQEQFFDDVYYSSNQSKEEASVEKNIKEEQDEKKIQKTLLDIKRKYGKNAILKGMNLEEGATAKERNEEVGGHKG